MRYIACYGDSLIEGFPYGQRYSWTAAVEKQGKLKMLNYGICGECCDDIVYRVRMYALPEYVKHIVFLGGANDLLQGRRLDDVLYDYQRLVDWCAEKQYALCIVLPLISSNAWLNERLVPLRDAIVEKYTGRVLLLDLQPAIGLTDEERRLAYLDEVHPKSKTYETMGVLAAPILSQWVFASDSCS